MKIFIAIDIKTVNKTTCHRKCDYLSFIAAYCELFEKKLVFGNRYRYERCEKCMKARRRK